MEQRLYARKKDSSKVIAARMAETKSEMQHYQDSDFLIINDDFDKAKQELQAIIIGQRMTTAKQEKKHKLLLENLV